MGIENYIVWGSFILGVVVFVIMLVSGIINKNDGDKLLGKLKDVKENFVEYLGIGIMSTLEYFGQIRYADERAKWGRKRKFIFYVLIGTAFAWFYKISYALAITAVIFFVLVRFFTANKKAEKVDTDKENKELGPDKEKKEESVSIEDLSVDNVSERFSSNFRAFLVEIKLEFTSFFSELFDTEKQKSWEVDKNILLFMLISIPFTIAHMFASLEDILYFAAIVFFTYLVSEPLITKDVEDANLKGENEKLKVDLEAANKELKTANEQNEAHDSRELEVQKVLAEVMEMTKAKEMKTLLESLQKKEEEIN